MRDDTAAKLERLQTLCTELLIVAMHGDQHFIEPLTVSGCKFVRIALVAIQDELRGDIDD